MPNVRRLMPSLRDLIFKTSRIHPVHVQVLIYSLTGDVKLKADKIKALVEAVERHNSAKKVAILPIDENDIQVDVLSDLDDKFITLA